MLTRNGTEVLGSMWDFVTEAAAFGLAVLNAGDRGALTVLEPPFPKPGWVTRRFESEAQARADLAKQSAPMAGLVLWGDDEIIVTVHEEEDECGARFRVPLIPGPSGSRELVGTADWDLSDKIFFGGVRGPATCVDRARVAETPKPTASGRYLTPSVLEKSRTLLVEYLDCEFEPFRFRALDELARTLRWLDEPEAARAHCLEGAEDLVTHISPDWPGAWTWKTLTGALLMRAGQRDDASPWLESALTELLDDPAALPAEVGEIYYLMGDWSRAAAAAPGVISVLARARMGEPSNLDGVRGALVARITREGSELSRAIDYLPWTVWDWLEECLTLQAAAAGQSEWSHGEALSRNGLLLAPEATGSAHTPPVGTHLAMAVRIADGVEVEATLDVDDRGDTHVVLDPRLPTYLDVTLHDPHAFSRGYTYTIDHGPDHHRGFNRGNSLKAHPRLDGAAAEAGERLNLEFWNPPDCAADGRLGAQTLQTLMEKLNAGSATVNGPAAGADPAAKDGV